MRAWLLSLSLLILVTSACGGGPASSPDRSAAQPQALSQEQRGDEIAVRNLPPEARRVLQLIQEGGPFPYAKDGAVFGNREGMLPARPRGYYREYTVETPGARDRGARRIIAGASGEYYYTADHYRSFKRIQE